MKAGLVYSLHASMSAKVGATAKFDAGSVLVENSNGIWEKVDPDVTKRCGVLLSDHDAAKEGQSVTVGLGVFNKKLISSASDKYGTLQAMGIVMSDDAQDKRPVN